MVKKNREKGERRVQITRIEDVKDNERRQHRRRGKVPAQSDKSLLSMNHCHCLVPEEDTEIKQATCFIFQRREVFARHYT